MKKFFNFFSEKSFETNGKKFGPFLDLCVSSLRRGHANLLCIVPILSDVSEETAMEVKLLFILTCFLSVQTIWVIMGCLAQYDFQRLGDQN